MVLSVIVIVSSFSHDYAGESISGKESIDLLELQRDLLLLKRK
jgi:hypothetical protein